MLAAKVWHASSRHIHNSGRSKEQLFCFVLFASEASSELLTFPKSRKHVTRQQLSTSLSPFRAECTGFAYLTVHFTFHDRKCS